MNMKSEIGVTLPRLIWL